MLAETFAICRRASPALEKRGPDVIAVQLMRLGPFPEDMGVPLFIFQTRLDRCSLRFHQDLERVHVIGELRFKRLQFFGELCFYAFLMSPRREKNRTQGTGDH